jgi:hypothetical protein
LLLFARRDVRGSRTLPLLEAENHQRSSRHKLHLTFNKPCLTVVLRCLRVVTTNSRRWAHVDGQTGNLVLRGGSVWRLEHGATASTGAYSLGLLGFRVNVIWRSTNPGGQFVRINRPRARTKHQAHFRGSSKSPQSIRYSHGIVPHPAKSCESMSNVGVGLALPRTGFELI